MTRWPAGASWGLCACDVCAHVACARPEGRGLAPGARAWGLQVLLVLLGIGH